VAKRTRMSAAERRSLIAAAAAARFAESGYDGTTLDDVAADAGVTKPVLYRHFGSKKDLYLELLRRHRDDLPGFLDGAAGGASDLQAILDGWFAYARANSHGWRMLFRDRGGDAEIAAFRGEVQQRARDVLAAWLADVADPPIPGEQLEPTAEVIRAGLAGLILWWVDHPDAEREDLVAAVVRLLGPIST
jgi:AcrR family transcriptional regulator